MSLGVFEKTGSNAPTLVARSPGPVDLKTDWDSTDSNTPQAICVDSCPRPNSAMPEDWIRFNLARYEVRTGDYAFGIRVSWSEGYAGGGASFEGPYLFGIDGKDIRPIFAQPMSFSKMIAGDWHKDRTRDHEETGTSNSLLVLPSQTSGFHDLQLREQQGKWRQTFKWVPSKGSYAAGG